MSLPPYKFLPDPPVPHFDYEHEIDSDITLRSSSNPQSAEYKNCLSPLHRSHPTPPRSIRSGVAHSREFHQMSNGSEYDDYDDDDEDDDDYYPSSDGFEDEIDEEDTEYAPGMLQKIQPDIHRIETAVILSTLISTALGIVIGYLMFAVDLEGEN